MLKIRFVALLAGVALLTLAVPAAHAEPSPSPSPSPTWTGPTPTVPTPSPSEPTPTPTPTEPTPTPTEPSPSPTEPSPTPTEPPAPPAELMELAASIIDAVRAQTLDALAEFMDRMLAIQRDLLGGMSPELVAEIIENANSQVEARLRLDLESMGEALDRTIANADSRKREAEARRLQAEREKFQAKVERREAKVHVVMRSTPQLLGTVAVAPDGSLAVQLPDGVSGEHHLALIDVDTGLIYGWAPIAIEPVRTGEGALPRVGSELEPAVLALAAAFGISGVAVWTRASSRPRPVRTR